MLQTHLSIDERARLCYPETLLFMCYVNSQFVSFYTGVGLFPRRTNHHHHGPNYGLWERKLMRRYTLAYLSLVQLRSNNPRVSLAI